TSLTRWWTRSTLSLVLEVQCRELDTAALGWVIATVVAGIAGLGGGGNTVGLRGRGQCRNSALREPCAIHSLPLLVRPSWWSGRELAPRHESVPERGAGTGASFADHGVRATP